MATAKNVSVPIALETLDLFDTTVVNDEQTNNVVVVSFMIALITVVNVPIAYSVHKEKCGTFINKLILLDCGNAMAHVPILLQHFQ